MYISSTEKQNWFAILCYLLYLFLLLVVRCTKSRESRVKRVCTKSAIYSLPCMSCILPFFLFPNRRPLLPPPPLDFKPSCARIAPNTLRFFFFYVDGLQTSSVVGTAEIAEDSGKTRLVTMTYTIIPLNCSISTTYYLWSCQAHFSLTLTFP